MVNYIRAEWYKVFRRKYLYIAMVLLLGAEALLVSGWVFTNAHGNNIDFSFGGGMAVTMLTVGLYAVIIVSDLVFSDQYKCNTLKNEVACGLPRARIYLGKLVVASILGVVLSVIAVAFYEMLCRLTLLPGEPGSAEKTLIIVGYCVLVALPQWLGMLSVSILVSFLVRSGTVAAFVTLAVIVVPQTALKLMGLLVNPVFSEIALRMPTSMIDNARELVGDWQYLALSWGLGAAWFIGAAVIGLICFRRKEIN